MSERPFEAPKARRDGVLVREIDDETVVYDIADDSAHLLNPTTARVFALADGTRSVAELATSVDADPEKGRALVLEAIACLEAANLLERSVDVPDGMTRRALLRRVGIAALAIPVVTTLAASPAAAAAISTSSCTGRACTGGNVTCTAANGCRCCGPGSAFGNNTCVLASVPVGPNCT